MGSIENNVYNPIHVRTLPGSDPSVKGAYLFSFADVSGVAAANNFLAITNPVGSGVNVVMPFVFIAAYAGGASATAASMKINVSGAASGGTDEAANTIKFLPTMPTHKAVVRSNNPTATIGKLLIGTPPPFSTGVGASSIGAFRLEANSVTGTYLLTEGESFTFRTESGDIDQRWNITIAWVEI